MLIGFLGAPCAGKTTLALGLGYELKKHDCAVEYIPEMARHLSTLNKAAGKTGRLDQTALYTGERDTHAMYKNTLPNSVIIADVCCTVCALYGYSGNVDDMIRDARLYDMIFFCKLPPAVEGAVPDANRFHNREQALKLEARAFDLIDTYKLSGVEILESDMTINDRVAHALECVLKQKRKEVPLL